ncbi:tRNA (adenosine(37)-N6)-threonylcarbamoyltransferase complex dimerization subunit type 1 TsaB [Thiohalobacter thiocyanaticus]|uniref:tRNA threonylcarbamoyladenosine biosynthesis protein TsaB n=1 Tax=Thiohalobacter thiocyanaticus TaxID=585455 RepID=A0A426QFV8_9GAMM|nr:tRNA (adenosine(37)-N6)-threonylcarbamoyltransferase complex dimerization subunit type 1 TsaB [Thiohalobacter thiocyanaticus]RRQ20638.1 tRNA (adenosine(37)-N6)-threonylcarbamoyltransferase complex dimerization subunit type 1 TsaB [Thiohalobacter thiocyanaticus]
MNAPAQYILALDTATEACSAALYVQGDMTSTCQVDPRGHARNILPMIEELLNGAGLAIRELNAIAFGRGPGSFTGLRIAAGITQGLAFGAGLPVIPVSTLATLAQGSDNDEVLAAIDARMHEVYWGAFRRDRDGVMQPVVDETVRPPDRVTCPGQGEWQARGSGWKTYGEALNNHCTGRIVQYEPDALPHAADMIPIALQLYRQGRTVSAEQAVPIYLRDQVVQTPSKSSIPLP